MWLSVAAEATAALSTSETVKASPSDHAHNQFYLLLLRGEMQTVQNQYLINLVNMFYIMIWLFFHVNLLIVGSFSQIIFGACFEISVERRNEKETEKKHTKTNYSII